MKRVFVLIFGIMISMMFAAGTSGADPTVELKDWACPVPVPTFTTQVTDRPDSGLHGTWALDTFKRTTTVKCNIADPNVYKVVLTDVGTFKTVAGKSPQVGVPLSGEVVGKFSGSATMTVTSAEKPHAPPATNAGDVSSSEWPSLLFDEYSSVMGSWGWNYTRLCEFWKNAAAGNSGDITGKSCYKPPTSTTTSTTPLPVTTTTTATAPVTTTTTPAPGGEGVRYANCDAVEAAGKAPLNAGAPGYSADLDSDTDGVACEAASKPVKRVATGNLAETGATGIGWMIGIGSLLLLGGVLGVAVARKRRKTS